MSTTDDVTTALLDVGIGDEVSLEAETYAWAAPFRVADVDDHEFEAASAEETWRARQIALESTDARGSARELTVVEGRGPPDAGSTYGPIVDVYRSVPDAPGRLARPAPEIVETCPGADGLELSRVLEVVETESDVIGVHRRLSMTNINQTQDLLWELDLCGPSRTSLRPADELEAWIDELRERYSL